MKFHQLAPFVLLAAVACQASGAPTMVRTEAPTRVEVAAGCDLEVPSGWVYSVAMPDTVIVSRENPYLHAFSFGLAATRNPADAALFSAAQTPAELAESTLTLLKREFSQVELKSSEPVLVDGHPACRLRLVAQASEQRMPPKDVLVVMMTDGQHMYRFAYFAWRGEHFERDLPTVEAALASVRLPAGER